MKKYILILMFIVESLSAAHMKVTLKNNTFDIYSSCSNPSKSRGNYKCNKYYIIKLQSKYGVFENYNLPSHFDPSDKFGYLNNLEISTNLYNIIPFVYNPNKTDLYLRISEDDLNKILRSQSIKIILPLEIFSQSLLIKEYHRIW